MLNAMKKQRACIANHADRYYDFVVISTVIARNIVILVFLLFRVTRPKPLNPLNPKTLKPKPLNPKP